MKTRFFKTTLFVSIFSLSIASCKKEKEETIEKKEVFGCMDQNSPSYNPNATVADNSCTTIYATDIEVSTFPIAQNGNDWDYGDGVQRNPDVYVRIKKSSQSTWYETQEDNNAATGPLSYSIATHKIMDNSIWEWEVLDHDITSNDDLIASGTFNPLESIEGGTIILSSGTTSIKIYCVVQ